VLFSVVAAGLARRSGGGAGNALSSWFAGIVLPFLCFGIVRGALGGDGLARSTRALVAFGASPVKVAFGSIGAGVAISATLAAVLGLLVAVIAHGASDPRLAGDALTTAWVSGLGGATYAALFALGGSFGKRGGGRAVALAVDWILGQGGAVTGVVTPRAHLRSLLGGEAVASLSGTWSALALVALTFVFAMWAARRGARG